MLPAVGEYHAVSAMLLLRIKFFQLLIITHHLPDIFIEVNRPLIMRLSTCKKSKLSHELYTVRLRLNCTKQSCLKICIFSFFNLYHSLGIFSRRQIDDIFLIFPRKQDLTFHANCLLRRQFAWNVLSCFLRKIRKKFQNVVCWKFYPEC